jgi:hypothetical protein
MKAKAKFNGFQTRRFSLGEVFRFAFFAQVGLKVAEKR